MEASTAAGGGKRLAAALLVVTLAAMGVAAALAPLERTLGASSRLVFFHGAWVWGALGLLAASALAGLGGLVLRRQGLHAWSLALGRSGTLFWAASLLLSLLVMQVSWGGFFWDEPRWRIPLAFGVAGVLLQAGLWLVGRPALASAGNLLFAAALGWNLLRIESVLHPESPILQSGSGSIRLVFGILAGLCLLAGVQLARMLRR